MKLFYSKKMIMFLVKNLLKYFIQSCSAIYFLHNITAHRDIKHENLLDDNNNVKLWDFGWWEYISKNVSMIFVELMNKKEYKIKEELSDYAKN